MRGVNNYASINKIMESNREVAAVFDELMENIRNVKDIIEDSDESVCNIKNIPIETLMLTDTVNKKINTLEHKAEKVGKLISGMLSSIDEGNMIIDETMRDIKNNKANEDDINNNLYSISKKVEKVLQYSKKINK